MANGASLGWMIDWEHRYGVSRDASILPVFDTSARITSSSSSPSPPPAPVPSPASAPSPAPPSLQEEQDEAPPQVSEFASQTDDESSSEVLPSQPSERDLASLLLAKPTLTRSETKSTIAARIAASGRSDVMADGGGLSDLRPALPVPSLGPRGHSSPMAKNRTVDEQKHDLYAAQAKEDGSKDPRGPMCRHLLEDSIESLDGRECLHLEWSQRYGINSRSPSPGLVDVLLPPQQEQAGPAAMAVSPLASPGMDSSVCSHCEEQPANVICPPCGSLAFCSECDTVLHRAVRLRQHVRRRTEAAASGEGGGPSPTLKKSSTPYFEIDRHEIRILAKLGEGYFGIVYKGLWAGQNVAVKKLKHGTRRHVDEFVNECLILGKLRHPNITTFYGVTASPDWLIVTELLHGSLYKLLHGQTKPIPSIVLRRIAKDVACGAAYIHGLNPSIVHRDINSSNVLLTGDIHALTRIVEEGRREPLAKLSDFGLSRSVERFMTQCTGNAYYLAPEVFRGQHYTEKADCYSYGILLWELFTRKYPFANLNPRSAAFQQAEMHLRPPIADGEVDPEVVSIMTRAWDADPERRMAFKDIVAEWCRMDGAVVKEGEAKGSGDEGGGGVGREDEKWADRTSVNGEYLVQPMEWRRRLLDDKLLHRPTVLQVMQKDLLMRPAEGGEMDGGESETGGAADERGDASLFGYDCMPRYLEM